MYYRTGVKLESKFHRGKNQTDVFLTTSKISHDAKWKELLSLPSQQHFFFTLKTSAVMIMPKWAWAAPQITLHKHDGLSKRNFHIMWRKHDIKYLFLPMFCIAMYYVFAAVRFRLDRARVNLTELFTRGLSICPLFKRHGNIHWFLLYKFVII